MHKPITLQEKFNVTDDQQLYLLREFWGNNNAHVILTAEADSLPTDEKKLLDDYGLVGCRSSRSNDLSVHAGIDSTAYVRLLWESSEEDDKNTHAAIFEVKFGKKAEEVITDSREGTADTLFNDLESVALAMEGSDLNTAEDNLVPTARCIQDTKERQLVTRSGFPSLRCCVCHLLLFENFFKTVLQQVCRFKIDVIAGDANAAAYKYLNMFVRSRTVDMFTAQSPSVEVRIRM